MLSKKGARDLVELLGLFYICVKESMKSEITKTKDGNSIYLCKDNRLRIYIKESHKTVSYPKYLMEETLGRKLLANEEVHHKDRNPLNNELSNLEVRIRGEHQAEHSTKYKDKIAVCGWCGKEFLWTGPQQQRFYTERRLGRHNSPLPFCSRSCVGHYGKELQEDKNGSCRKLTHEQVKYIRDKYIPFDKNYGERALSRFFGVDKTVISSIVKGETYKEIY